MNKTKETCINYWDTEKILVQVREYMIFISNFEISVSLLFKILYQESYEEVWFYYLDFSIVFSTS